jgi:hypothetical protein
VTASGERAWRRRIRRAVTPSLLATSFIVMSAESAGAQLFISSRPEPPFTIGPLMIRGRITEGVSAVTVNVLWSLALRADVRPADVAQDLYLLWPGEVESPSPPAGKPDASLTRYVEERGFSVVGDGRLELFAQSLTDSAHRAAEAQPGGVPFVVFVLEDGVLGLSPPATLIRIPWSTRLTDRGWLMDLRMRVRGLIKPREGSWAERLFVGGRSLVTLSFNEVRDRPLFPMYLSHRDRVVRLADAPSELAATFADAHRLKIDEVFPPTAIRRLSETEETTEVVSLFLDNAEGITPQHLTVQFGYYSRMQAWALVLIPTVFFIMGQAIGPVVGRALLRAANNAGARVHLGGLSGRPRIRQSGVIIPREVLARIVPGETTLDQVVHLCGTPSERYEQFPASEHRTLIYRGRRLVPKMRRRFAWFSTVEHWDVERDEVRIELEREVVRDVQAQTRYYRASAEEATGAPSPAP